MEYMNEIKVKKLPKKGGVQSYQWLPQQYTHPNKSNVNKTFIEAKITPVQMSKLHLPYANLSLIVNEKLSRKKGKYAHLIQRQFQLKSALKIDPIITSRRFMISAKIKKYLATLRPSNAK